MSSRPAAGCSGKPGPPMGGGEFYRAGGGLANLSFYFFPFLFFSLASLKKLSPPVSFFFFCMHPRTTQKHTQFLCTISNFFSVVALCAFLPSIPTHAARGVYTFFTPFSVFSPKWELVFFLLLWNFYFFLSLLSRSLCLFSSPALLCLSLSLSLKCVVYTLKLLLKQKLQPTHQRYHKNINLQQKNKVTIAKICVMYSQIVRETERCVHTYV